MSSPGATLAVELENATVRFTSERGSVTALENVGLAVQPGGFVSLLGPSGCGKSTLLRLVADLVSPTHGTVSVLGGPPERARLNRELGFVFQDATLLPWRSALENVRLPLEVGPKKRDRAGLRKPEELCGSSASPGVSTRCRTSSRAACASGSRSRGRSSRSRGFS